MFCKTAFYVTVAFLYQHNVETRESNSCRFEPDRKDLDFDVTFSTNFLSKFKAIFPGTKWCGDRNIASAEDDLGIFSKIDKCCRAHDYCPYTIPSGLTKYGLKNTGLLKKSHCTCDLDLYNCLKKLDCLVANTIGFIYFNILGPQCFKDDYSISGCLQKKLGRCIEYSTDEKSDKKCQWFDDPLY